MGTYIALAVSVATLVFLCYARKSIKICVTIVSEASQVIYMYWSMLFWPIVPILASFILFFWAITIAALLATSTAGPMGTAKAGDDQLVTNSSADNTTTTNTTS